MSIVSQGSNVVITLPGVWLGVAAIVVLCFLVAGVMNRKH